MDYQSFLRKQEEIYQGSFRVKVAEVCEAGLLPDPALTERHGGFFAFYKHGEEISGRVAAVADRIAEIVPCIAYTPDMIHTTICTYGVAPRRIVDQWCPSDREIILKFEGNVFPPPLTRMPIVGINYADYLMNQTTVIVRGTPTLGFVTETNGVVDRLRDAGIEVRPPWGAHITVARFTEAVTDREKIERLIQLLASASAPGESLSPVVRIGHFAGTPNKFRITTIA